MNQGSRILKLATCLAACALSGCEAERAPQGVTCAALRSLRVGMSVEQVASLLGAPDWDVRQDGQTMFRGPDGTDRQWSWDGPVRLYVSFGDGRLLGVQSWIRTMWRDVFDNESRPTLVALASGKALQEGELFERVYCPGTQ